MSEYDTHSRLRDVKYILIMDKDHQPIMQLNTRQINNITIDQQYAGTLLYPWLDDTTCTITADLATNDSVVFYGETTPKDPDILQMLEEA